MRKSRVVTLTTLVSTAALVLAACSTAEPTTASSSSGASTPASSSTGSAPVGSSTAPTSGGGTAAAGADPTFTRPKVASSPNVSIAVEENNHDYNNGTSTAANFANSQVGTLVQPSAYINDPDLKLYIDADVMTSVTETSKSPQTIVWKVNPKAVWSDGVAVDCKDFYLAWLSAESKATVKGADGKPAPAFDPASTSGYDQMKAPVCSDGGKTITTVFSSPFADWRGMFAFMVPAHMIEKDTGVADITKLKPTDTTGAVAKFAASYIKNFAGFNAKFDLSAGPYLQQSQTDAQVVMVRNPKWWGNPGGPTSLTLITNADGQGQVQSLQNQEVQVIQPQPDSALATQLKSLPNVTFNAHPGVTFEHLDFNVGRKIFQGVSGKALRQAFFYCVDRTDIITKLVKGVNDKTQPLGNVMFLPNESAYQDHYAQYGKADVAKAKAAMEAGGWKLGSDGVYAIGGQKAEFKLGHKVIDTREKVAQLVNGSCSKAGIKVDDDQDANFNSKRLPASEYDVALFAWVGTPYKSGIPAIYIKGGGENWQGYDNPTVDKLLAATNTELDQTKRAALFNQADKLIADDLVTLPTYQFSDMDAQTTAISPTLTYNGPNGGVFWNAFEWVYKQ